MQVHVFRGPGRVFAVTQASGGENLQLRFAPWTPFKTVDLMEGQAQPGLNVAECLDDIKRFGVHVTDAHVRITEQAMG